jgi:hypothetical protein
VLHVQHASVAFTWFVVVVNSLDILIFISVRRDMPLILLCASLLTTRIALALNIKLKLAPAL